MRKNGEQSARFVHIFADVAVVAFTLAKSPLFSLCVGEIGMKLGCAEAMSRFGQALSNPAHQLS